MNKGDQGFPAKLDAPIRFGGERIFYADFSQFTYSTNMPRFSALIFPMYPANGGLTFTAGGSTSSSDAWAVVNLDPVTWTQVTVRCQTANAAGTMNFGAYAIGENGSCRLLCDFGAFDFGTTGDKSNTVSFTPPIGEFLIAASCNDAVIRYTGVPGRIPTGLGQHGNGLNTAIYGLRQSSTLGSPMAANMRMDNTTNNPPPAMACKWRA